MSFALSLAGLLLLAPTEPDLGAPPPTADAAPPTAQESSSDVYDYKLSFGPYVAGFSEDFGYWAGLHARAWLLDVTGKRGYSGFVEVVDLHWRGWGDKNPNRPVDAVDTAFFLGRALKYWNQSLYTFLTVGGSLGDALFPRGQIEVEADWIVPTWPALVLCFGGGDRRYAEINRPYLIAGASYSLAKAAAIYRYWYDGGIGRKPAHTHLFTLVVGERLVAWGRLDLTWGDEGHPGSTIPTIYGEQVKAKAVAASLERWFRPNFGIIFKAELSEATLPGSPPLMVHRYLGEIRPFVTF